MLDRTGKFLFTGGEDGLIKLWDLESGRAMKEYTGHCSPVYDCSISHDNAVLLSSDLSGKVIVWDVERGEKIFQHDLEDQVDSVEFISSLPTVEPYEIKKKNENARKRKRTRDVLVYRMVAITAHGKVVRIALSFSGGAVEHMVETLMETVDENSFRSSSITCGGRISLLAGMWPFALAFDLEDRKGRFMVVDTDDLFTSATAASADSLKFVFWRDGDRALSVEVQGGRAFWEGEPEGKKKVQG